MVNIKAMLEWFELKVNTNYKIKKHNLHCVIFLLVTRTGFEPMNACVKGM